ncbi:MAG: DUF5057 domain-containing protein, partial [Mobilitalea sp.]
FRTLQYKFYISSENASSSEYYTAKLYIDVNADGKYDEATENMSSLQIINDSNYAVNYKRLQPGVNYTLTRTLEEDYYGVLPWKLEIVSSTNNEIRDSVIDYSALETAAKIDLYILQIKANDNTNNNYDNNLDLAAELANPSSTFYSLINTLNDYTIHIQSWDVNTFIYKSNHRANNILSDDYDNGTSGINHSSDDNGDGYYDFDMIIMGFADCYSDIGDAKALQNIDEFIEEGKSVLFTHDTTSFVNLPSGSYSYGDFWGYGLNSTFRNVFGMDRFGVTLASETDRSTSGKDYAYKNSSGTKIYSGYIQGYSNMILNRYASSGQLRSHINVPTTNYEDSFKTSRVTNANKGQLTVYPYNISDSFGVATTHAQYYQLDMENKNIVVWYCLSDNNTNGLYSTTPNDVRNNYYIYNNGNITYSGVGHSKVTSVMEAKLFVNTMIGAYSATAKAPQIVVTNKNTSKIMVSGQQMQYVYVDYDIYDTTLATGSEITTLNNAKDSTISLALGTVKAEQVKFRIADNNILFNKKIYVSFFDDPMGTKTAHRYYLINTEDNTVVASSVVVEDGKNTYRYKINAWDEYAIAVPLSRLDEYNTSGDIGVNVLITYGKTSNKTKTATTTIKLVRRGLFDLD